MAALLIRFMLRRYPLAVVRALSNGRTALAAYDQDGADLLFVNHWDARHGWPTFIRTLRGRGDMVPIIGMSGDPTA